MAEPKYQIGAFLRIPGGFTGRVTEVYNGLPEAFAQDADLKEFGAEAVIRGVERNPPEGLWYKVVNNGALHSMIVGELAAHLIAQPPA